MGKPTLLNADEEHRLVQLIHVLAEAGLPVDRPSLRHLAYNYLVEAGRNKENCPPGRYWVKNFLERHKNELSIRIPQNFPNIRAKLAAKTVEDWFDRYESKLEQLEIRDRPAQIWNCDETALSSDPGKTKIICPRGMKNPHRLTGPDLRKNYTVLCCCNAEGKYLPPLLIFEAANLYSSWCVGGPEGVRLTVIPRQMDGWWNRSSTIGSSMRTCPLSGPFQMGLTFCSWITTRVT